MRLKKTTLALVGRGAWGRNYIHTISKISKDLLPSHYIKTHDYKELLNKKDIDGVIITTPAPTHYKIAKDFLKQRFNVLIEKPLTLNSNHALELKMIASQKKSIAMVGHIYLYNPAFDAFKKYIKRVGKILYIESSGASFGPFRKDVSALWDWAPHDVSILLDLFGKPKSCLAWGLNSDMYFIRLNFKSISAFISCGRLSPVKKRSITIVGEKGAVIFDDVSARKVSYIKKLERNPKVFYPSYPKDEPLKLEIREFIGSIKNKKKPKTSLDQGIEVTKTIEAAEKSIKRNGREVML